MQIVRTRLSKIALRLFGAAVFPLVGIGSFIGYQDHPLAVRRGMGLLALVLGVGFGAYILASTVAARRGIIVGRSSEILLRHRDVGFRGMTADRISQDLADLQIDIQQLEPKSDHPKAKPEVRITVFGSGDEISVTLQQSWICDGTRERFEKWKRTLS